MTENNFYPLVYEEKVGSMTMIEVHYDSDGEIGMIFTKWPLSDRLVKAMVPAFIDMHPREYSRIKAAIQASLNLPKSRGATCA